LKSEIVSTISRVSPFGRFVGVARLGVVEAELLFVVGVDAGQIAFLGENLGRCHVS